MKFATMKCLIVVFIGLAILICGTIDSYHLLSLDLKLDNSTVSSHVSPENLISSNMTAISPANVHIHPANVSVDPIRWSLYSLQAFGDKHSSTSQ